MNLTERLAAAEAELAAIKKQIQDEQVGSLLSSAHWPAWCDLIVPSKDYFDAISTMLILRQQPGSEAAKDGVNQWVIKLNVTGEPDVTFWMDLSSKATRISPCFYTKEHAEAAIQAVGADRIAQMFKTLHGVS